MFAGLPAPPPKRWAYRGYALIVQAVALAGLIELGVLTPSIIEHQETQMVIPLTLPAPISHKIQTIPPALVRPPREVLQQPPKLAELTPVAPPKIAAPTVAPPRIEAKVRPPQPAVSTKPVFESATVAKTDPKPGPAVRTGSFNSIGSSATPTTTLEASKVQTGGFGDPNGVAAEKTSNAAPNIAKVGSFDLPSGKGSGNGTGGDRGARGVVASAGFGNGVAASGGGGHANGAVVRSTAFDSSAPAVGTGHPAASSHPATTAAEVLSKPTPAYTAEARSLKLQGEVLLRVVFRASGKVEVLRVVRGLGHGLDESAVQAAEKIKFKPATRGGSPVDSEATLHIVFQLA
ncbi:MAG: energy transducer TonB [Terriglobales bacterium]